jgi:putative membrane protein
MIHNPYTKFRGRDLTLNDHLAIDRTVLSNERTLLAYGRTSMAMLIIGGSCLKFFESVWMQALGVPFLLGGLLVMGRGWGRFRRTERFLSVALEQQTGSPDHPLKTRVNAEGREARAGAASEAAATSARSRE